MNLNDLKELKQNDRVYYKDKFAGRTEEWRVNGKLKVNGDSFSLPMKYGNKKYAITDSNIQYFSLEG